MFETNNTASCGKSGKHIYSKKYLTGNISPPVLRGTIQTHYDAGTNNFDIFDNYLTWPILSSFWGQKYVHGSNKTIHLLVLIYFTWRPKQHTECWWCFTKIGSKRIRCALSLIWQVFDKDLQYISKFSFERKKDGWCTGRTKWYMYWGQGSIS